MKLIFLLLLSFGLRGQDSVKLKITKVLTSEKKVYYWLKDVASGARYYTVCECKPVRKKGEVVTLVKKDMEFIEGKIKYE